MSKQSKVMYSEFLYDRYCCGWTDSWRLRSAHKFCLSQEWLGIGIQLRNHQYYLCSQVGHHAEKSLDQGGTALAWLPFPVCLWQWEAWDSVWCHLYECCLGWREPSSNFIASADMDISEWKSPFNFHGDVYRSRILSYRTHFPAPTRQLECFKTSLLLSLPST